MATVRVLDRSIPAPAYLAGIRAAKAHPDATFKHSLWHWSPDTGAEIMRQYLHDLHRRINERGGIDATDGRVHPANWQYLRDRRLILRDHMVRGLNRHARHRFTHRLLED